MAFSLSRNERIFLQIQSAFGTIPNTSGTATVAGANACRFIKAGLNPAVVLLTRPDKTGVRTPTQGIAGRKNGSWAVEMSLAANGAAGVKPDCDPILQALIGQAATIGSGTIPAITGASNATPIVVTSTAHGLANGDLITITGVVGNTAANGVWVVANVAANTFELVGSVGNGAYTSGGTGSKVNVKYAISDAILSFCLWAFRTPAALQQRVGFGCVAQEATFNLGQDVATWTANGEGLWVLDSDNFSSADSTQKGGLTTFPVEPASPVTNGGIIAGFTGRAVLDGKTLANIKNATLRIQTGNVTVKDSFGSYYPDSAEGDERNVTVDFTVDDQDDTATKNLYTKALDKTAIEIILNIGTVVGSVFVFYLKGVQLPVGTLDDGQRRFQRSYSGAKAHGSSLTSLDEVALWVA